jgi:hypothetical protein
MNVSRVFLDNDTTNAITLDLSPFSLHYAPDSLHDGNGTMTTC